MNWADRLERGCLGRLRFDLWWASGILWLALSGPLPEALAEALANPVTPGLITSAVELSALSPESAAKGLPVRIRGVITYCDPDWHLLFVQELLQPSAKALFFTLPDSVNTSLAKLEAGALVEVKGITLSADGEPQVKDIHARVVGQGKLPVPKPLASDGRFAPEDINKYIDTTALITDVNDRSGRLLLEAMQGIDHAFSVVVLNSDRESLAKLVNAVVSIDGVLTLGGQVRGHPTHQLLVSDLSQIVVFEKGQTDLFAARVSSCAEVERLGRAGDVVKHARLTRVAGEVVSVEGGTSFVLRDATGELLVHPKHNAKVRVGDRVEVAGFPFLETPQQPNRLVSAVVQPLISTAAAAGVAPPASVKPIDSIRAIRALSPDSARDGSPVRIRATVTYFDREWQVLFVHDGKDGIYVSCASPPEDLRAGVLVEVDGVTAAGSSVPVVARASLRRLGPGTFPTAVRPPPGQARDPRLDCEWLGMVGVVRSVEAGGTHIVLHFTGRHGDWQVVLPEAGGLTKDWIGKPVTAIGVGAIRVSASGRVSDFILHVPERHFLRAAPTSSLPDFTMAELEATPPGRWPEGRVKLTGAITAVRSGIGPIFHDGTGGILLRDAPGTFRAGDQVEVIGFAERLNDRVVLRDYEIHPIGYRTPAPPKFISASALQFDVNLGRRVTLEGVLADKVRTPEGVELTIESQPYVFDALISSSEADGPLFERLQTKTLLRVTGVCLRDEWDNYRPQVLIQGSEAIVPITRTVSYRDALWLAGAVGAVGLLAAIWAVLLRKQVRRQTAIIHDRVRKEAAMERRLADLVENANDVIFTVDLTGRFTSVNRMAEALSGRSRESLLCLSLWEWIEPEEHDSVKALFTAVAAGESRPPVEMRVRSPEGEVTSFEVSARAILEGGRPVGIQGIARDITARKQAEAKLREREIQLRKLSQAVEQSPASILITNPQGVIEYVNPQCLKSTGYTQDELLGKKPSLLKSGQTPANDYAHLWDTIKAGGQWRGEFRNRRKDGSLFTELAQVSPILDEQGKVTHFIAVKEDVTAQRNLEQELRHAQKMESVGQLAAGVAHDYNNVLTVIKGHLELLVDESGFSDIVQESLQEISAATERAATLTRQLLAFSRRQVLQKRVLDMNELVGNLVKMLQRLLREDISLEVRPDSNPPMVYADPGMLEQVLMNLAVNARDAMPSGGRLAVVTRIVDVDEEHRRRNPEAQLGAHVCLSVKDTGCGMDEATRERIFEPFFTTKPQGKGTGLGLATVFGIVKQHSGWVEVETAPGAGSTFSVFLPMHLVNSDQKRPPLRTAAAQAEGGTETVLVVEDEPALRAITSRILTRAGYSVLTADSGPAAAAVWEQEQSSIDLLLTDMVMPGGMTGRELAQKLKQAKPTLTVIYTSGYSVDLTGADRKWARESIVLQKPFEAGALLRAVRRALDGAPPQRNSGTQELKAA